MFIPSLSFYTVVVVGRCFFQSDNIQVYTRSQGVVSNDGPACGSCGLQSTAMCGRRRKAEQRLRIHRIPGCRNRHSSRLHFNPARAALGAECYSRNDLSIARSWAIRTHRFQICVLSKAKQRSSAILSLGVPCCASGRVAPG